MAARSQSRHRYAADAPRLNEVLEYGRKYTAKYEGDWTAIWLKTHIRETKWRVLTNESRLVGDKWTGTIFFHWDYRLPDGTRFDHVSHDRMRALSQDMTFLVRERHLFSVSSTLTHKEWFHRTKALTQWLYLNNDVFQPDVHCFSRIDTAAIADFMDKVKEGGIAWVLRLPERTLTWMYREALGTEPNWNKLDRGYQVPGSHKKAIVEWLESIDGYSNHTHDWTDHQVRSINRRLLEEQLSVESETLNSSPKYVAFLRQFEPDILEFNHSLLIPVRGIRSSELPSHRMPLIAEILKEPYCPRGARGFLRQWFDICRFNSEFPNNIPDSANIDQEQLYRYSIADNDKHTPLVPLPIALVYTREALRWVSRYEEALIGFYLKAVDTFEKNKWFSYQSDSASHDWALSKMRDDWVRRNIPEELKPLNIASWTCWASKTDRDVYKRIRERPSLNDAMQIMVGAIIILTAILKPLRESEFRKLERKCIRYAKGDGFWLKQVLRKAGVSFWLPEIERPIPKIVAMAIDRLGRLGASLLHYSKDNDTYAQNKLLYLPQFVRDASLKMKLMGNRDITRFLNYFCDYVGLDPDEHGRRWYIRIHEMRKSFLLTLFWCFRFSSLGAGSWMAGHKSVEEMYDYIAANVPGEELPHICAEHANHQLWAFGQGRPTDLENVEVLYRDVCEHFGVRELNLIPADELSEWLEEAFRSGAYDIVPFTVELKGGQERVAVAFKIGPKKTA